MSKKAEHAAKVFVIITASLCIAVAIYIFVEKFESRARNKAEPAVSRAMYLPDLDPTGEFSP